MLFHIESNSRSEFASDINKFLIECHSKIEELIANNPDVVAQEEGVEDSLMGEPLSLIPQSIKQTVSEEVTKKKASEQYPFFLLGNITDNFD